ncbi:MAG: acyl-CoA dehydrogenase family protein, partial [Thermoplasmata archaeon]
MIDFTPTEEQKLLVQTAHEFAEKEMRPVALEYDQKAEVPWDVIA